MNKPTSPHNQPLTPYKRAQPPRLREPLRKALSAMAEQGVTQRKAAEIAGLDETSLGRALKKPHVKAYLDAQRALFVADIDKLKGMAKALAIQTGLDLMRDTADERIKVKLVEFFAGEGQRGASVQVNVDARSGGYEFPRPGQRVVEIEGKATPLDTQSGDE